MGDSVVVAGQPIVLAGFLRDSQMSSSLAASKRFLISQNEYIAIRESGNIEYLIEFRLKDLSKLGEFENAYNNSGLEGNGPTITNPLFKFINGISDGLMIAVIMLISTILVIIALMCIRFSLLTKIEEDYQEIGIMKAMGLPIGEIKKIYHVKYLVIATTGCTFGYILSLVFKDLMIENIRLYFGESQLSFVEPLSGIIGILLIFLLIIL